MIVNANRRHAFGLNEDSEKNYFSVLIAINAGRFLLSLFVLYGGQHLMDTWC